MPIFPGLFNRPRERVSTLDPEQQRLQQTLGGRLRTLSQAPEQFPGRVATSITPGEESAIDRFNRLAAGGEETLTQLTRVDDPSFNQRFRSEIVDPTLRTFREDVAPLLEEALPSFSTARARVLQRALGDVQGQLLQQRFGAREAARDRAIRAAAEGRQQGVAGVGVAAVPREIEQAGLDREFSRFLQGNPQLRSNIDSALRFLGVQTFGEIEQPSNLERIVGLTQTVGEVADIFKSNFKGGE